MPLTRAARAYLILVGIAAIVIQALWLATPGRPVDLLILGQFAALGVLSQYFTLPAGGRRKIDFTIAMHYAVLLVAGLPVAMAVVGAEVLLAKGGMALWDRRRGGSGTGGAPRQTVRSVLFNTSQSMLSVALAGWVAGFVPAGLA
ncbi:MAG: hypothetical protein ACRDJN_21640, partial [Chloroflexota bacterium]